MLGSNVIEPNLANVLASDDDLEYADTFTEGLPVSKDNQSDYGEGADDEPMPEMTLEEDALRKELGMSEDEFWKMKLMREIEYVGEDDEHELKYASYHCGFDADLISLSQEEYENELERRSPVGEMKRQEYAKYMDEMRRNYRKIMK